MDADLGVPLMLPITLNEYQHASQATNKGTRVYVERPNQTVYGSDTHVVTSTCIYKVEHIPCLYNTLGLVGEAGEFADKVKKWCRDGKWDREAALKELGDVLWYVQAIACDLDCNLEDVARMNIEKLRDRKARGVLSGEGDNR